jgi:STE24 endopeptidase
MKSDAKKYNNIKLTVGIAEAVISFILMLLFVLLNYSQSLENSIRSYTVNDYLVLGLYVMLFGIISAIIFSPFSFYTGYYLEHKYNLSNQTFGKWILEGAKGTLVGVVIGLPILAIFFYVIRTFGIFWWIPFGIVLFILSVVLAQIVPVIILPIFYKVTPLDNESLKEKIVKLCKDANLKVGNVFKFDMSKNTKKANAAFTGLGKTKRILLGDTLLENYTEDEIETVIAHELGHYKRKHIVKNIFIGTVSSFLLFFLISHLHKISLTWFGFIDIKQISSFPLLFLWASLIGLIQTPLSNYISRKFEYEADDYAIQSTGKREAFISTLEKLTDQNLGDKEPHPIVEWFFYSHPSINRRIAHIRQIVIGRLN